MLYVIIRYPYIINIVINIVINISDCLNCECKFLVCYIITIVPLYYIHSMMPQKRLASSPASGKEPKRLKKVMALLEKVELLDMAKEG